MKHPLSTPFDSLPGFPGSVNGTLSPSSPRLFPLPGGKRTSPHRIWSVEGLGWEELEATPGFLSDPNPGEICCLGTNTTVPTKSLAGHGLASPGPAGTCQSDAPVHASANWVSQNPQLQQSSVRVSYGGRGTSRKRLTHCTSFIIEAQLLRAFV